MMPRGFSTSYRCTRDPRGQSVVEMALALPLVTLLLISVCDFARLFYASIGIADAARAGVQYGAQNRATAVDYPGMQQAALKDGAGISGISATATSFCECGGATVACSPAQCTNPANYVQVTASTSFDTILTYPGIPHSTLLSSTAVMEVP